MTTVLKLGGSVITDKDSPETLDEAALDAALDAVADAWRDGGDSRGQGNLVIVHGGGSFGHHHAAQRGVTATEGTRDARDTVAIHDAMGRLNREVVGRLHDRGVDALPVRPLSVASRSADGALDLPTGSVERMLAEGFCPVLHGDGCVQSGAGVTILSGDDIVVALARSLPADRIGLCSTVPGVLGGDGEVVERIDRFSDAEAALGGSDSTDVTGGMAGKVRTLLDLPVPAHVFGPDGLAAFLDGDSPGTVVAGGE
ncbi:acetylglutamate kinase [Halobacteriales archaeon QH_6_68_27]|jgi:isopentenyl phosphate kinase|nr:MAG: acetylglutamate kinase [Halobacteriales archaeon QH_6_68_27]